MQSVSEGVGSNLKVDHFRVRSFSGLAVEGRARTPRGEDAFALPASLGVVETPVHPFGVEAQRVGYAQYGELAVHQGEQRIRGIAGNDWRVRAQPQGIELIDPDVVMRVGAAGGRHVLELRARRLIQRPSFGAMPSGCLRPVERALALVPVEACQVPAR